jgi:small subunit ribosomal protein S7
MRRNRAERRPITPDPRYNSEVVAKFMNSIMERGKKSLAAHIVYQAFDIIEERTNRPAIEVFDMALAMRWLIDSARKRGGRDMSIRLAGELMDAARGEGATIKRREDTHRMAEANQAFAHFRV